MFGFRNVTSNCGRLQHALLVVWRMKLPLTLLAHVYIVQWAAAGVDTDRVVFPAPYLIDIAVLKPILNADLK